MSAEIITVASLKGGVGKTTTIYALATAAAYMGKRVIVVDLDPTRGLSIALESTKRQVTIADVIDHRASLYSALVEHPIGFRFVPGHRGLYQVPVDESLLREVIEPVLPDADIVLLDTYPHEPSLIGPLKVADRIVIPTKLDLLSLRAAALTVGLVQQLGAVERICGLVVVDANHPLSKVLQSYYDGLTTTGLTFRSELRHSSLWPHIFDSLDNLLDEESQSDADQLFREVMNEEIPPEKWENFGIGPRNGPGGAPVPAGGPGHPNPPLIDSAKAEMDFDEEL